MTTPVIAVIKPPTKKERDGIRRVFMLAEADADAMMQGERKDQQSVYAGLDYLHKLIAALDEAKP